MTLSNLELLAQYHYNTDTLSSIKFDKHGRPYIQDGGKIMLSRRGNYHYTINN